MRSRRRVSDAKGGYSGRGLRIGIVVSQFNEVLTQRLLDGTLDALLRYGVREKDLRVVHVPGAFEIPLAAKKLIARFRPQAVITLAVVIRGETRHFDQVVEQSAKGVRELSMKTEVPIILGVIPATNIGQALRRVGIKQTNKGREWALAAVEMANLMKLLGVRGRK